MAKKGMVKVDISELAQVGLEVGEGGSLIVKKKNPADSNSRYPENKHRENNDINSKGADF
ncbi:hypothetical protein MWH28_12175 [Natroniella sulfidigena]|uniref:hypothetical protein n=1 Tax=Natroniella sulfidigena TaxID=723921 RepID=UPI00200B9A5D|nr:hypothetical protein [Natroniella sulfidigena]MCK8818113.1 hypothetical protein [Natroniella sulfidigena]